MLEQSRDFAGGAIIGTRDSQQDAYGFAPPGPDGSLLVLLADGMGGHRGGRLAADTAIDAFHASWLDSMADESRRFLPPHRILHDCLCAANDAIADKVSEAPGELEGMGCTFVGAWMRDRKLHWASIGDSALYLHRGRTLHRLNDEHSLRKFLAMRVQRGEITEQEAATHPERNQLLSALTGDPFTSGGANEDTMIDVPKEGYPLQTGDVILVASDGLLTISEEDIRRGIELGSDEPVSAIVQRLLEYVSARRMKKQDNTTVAIIRVPKVIEPPPLP